MRREIRSNPATVEAIAVDSITDVKAWLEEQAAQYKLKWLLAHADDGVIWGKIANGALTLAPNQATLRRETLQAARVFNQKGELFVWRDGAAFRARVITDGPGNEVTTFDERQYLWGTSDGPSGDSFSPMTEGAQGMRHTVPLSVAKGKTARLTVRHYCGADTYGVLRVNLSRLVDLTASEGDK
ncbi:MAG: CRISPR-associated protein Csx19 [Dehalococcoidia bacterium]|nr:CRISPR-associated protein Csx19 [Dehalococcoidia bacterium]